MNFRPRPPPSSLARASDKEGVSIRQHLELGPTGSSLMPTCKRCLTTSVAARAYTDTDTGTGTNHPASASRAPRLDRLCDGDFSESKNRG